MTVLLGKTKPPDFGNTQLCPVAKNECKARDSLSREACRFCIALPRVQAYLRSVLTSGSIMETAHIPVARRGTLRPMTRPRVLLADDHALLLGAFEKLLAGECDVVGQASDGRALVAAAERLKPDVIVLDISMPLLNGLEAGRQIKQKLRDVKLVFLTMNEDADLAAEAFRSGASAYLLKRSAASELDDRRYARSCEDGRT